MSDEFVKNMLHGNRIWVEKMKREMPDLFNQLMSVHQPEVLWIGCSDARVPASEITNQTPGSIFVHRNIANQVITSDFNMLSVLYYSLYHLHIRDIIICGHYHCGGVLAAMNERNDGLIEGWIGHIRQIKRFHQEDLSYISDKDQLLDRLCELNVLEQMKNLSDIFFLQQMLSTGEKIRVHGWIYDVKDGYVRELRTNYLGD